MYGWLAVGLGGWNDGSDWAMCLQQISPSLFIWLFSQNSQEQQERTVPKYTSNFQVLAFATFAIVLLVKTSQWLGPGLVCEVCKREENYRGHFNNPPHMGSRVIKRHQRVPSRNS